MPDNTHREKVVQDEVGEGVEARSSTILRREDFLLSSMGHH